MTYYASRLGGSVFDLTGRLQFNRLSGKITYAQLPSGTGSWDTGVGTTATITRALTVSGLLTASVGINVTSGDIATVAGAIVAERTIGTQLWAKYDSSNYMNISVGSNGATVFDAIGAGAGFTFSDLLTASAGITSTFMQSGAAADLLLKYNTTTKVTIGTAGVTLVNVLNAPNGSAGSPSYTFTSNNNAGMYLSNAGTAEVGLTGAGVTDLVRIGPGVVLGGVGGAMPGTGEVMCESSLHVNGTAGLGSGAGVISIHNAGTNPSTNPSSGGILYCDAGALKYRGSSGTVTTLGAP